MVEISRRRLLGGALLTAGLAAGAALGTTRTVHHRVALPPPPPPSELTDALTAQTRLLAGYDQVRENNDSPALAGLRGDADAQRAALAALLELYPGWRYERAQPDAGTGSAVPTGSTAPSGASTSSAPSASLRGPSSGAPMVPASLAELLTAATAVAQRLGATAVQWPATEANALQVVPTLASIAAGVSSQADVLAALQSGQS